MIRRLAPLSLAAIAGCSVLVQPDLARLREGGTVATDGQAPADSALPGEDAALPGEDAVAPPADGPGCANNCDDNVACTIDRCNNGTCVNTPDNTACGADMRCDPARGCQPVMTMRCVRPSDCSDGDPCTVETCNSGTCANSPVDADMDGSPAAMVAGRMCAFANADCNDGNRAINPTAMEVCDRVDNNCNGMVDEAPACMMMGPPNATCATAARIDLTSSGSAEVSGDNSRVMSAVQGYCGRADGATGGEIWFQVVWPSGRDLVLEAIRGADSVDPVLFVSNGCGQPAIVCNDDIGQRERNARVFIRSESITGIGTRTVFVAVDSFNATSSGAVRLRARTQMPSGNDCGAGFTIDGGGAVRSSPSAGSLRQSLCAMGVGNTEYYRYRGGMGQVRLGTSSGTVAIRRDCTSMAFCPGMNTTFMSDGDSILAVDRPSGPYVFTVYGP